MWRYRIVRPSRLGTAKIEAQVRDHPIPRTRSVDRRIAFNASIQHSHFTRFVDVSTCRSLLQQESDSSHCLLPLARFVRHRRPKRTTFLAGNALMPASVLALTFEHSCFHFEQHCYEERRPPQNPHRSIEQYHLINFACVLSFRQEVNEKQLVCCCTEATSGQLWC